MVRLQSQIYKLNTTNISTVIGNFVFISESGSAVMEDAPKAGSVCFLCGKEMAKARMRDHIARHLVAKMMGISESLMQPVGLMNTLYTL